MWHSRLSIASRSIRYQFGIGIALISIIPILAFWSLKSSGLWKENEILSTWHLMLYFLIVAIGLTGYTLLRRYPVNITKLRNYLEHVIHGDLPEKVHLVKAEDDIVAIEKCMKLIVEELKMKLKAAEHETAGLRQQLSQAQKIESLSIMATGVAHSFNNLLTAILGNANIVLNSMSPEAPTRENAQQVTATALCAVELANQIMCYSGKGNLATEKLDISALIKKMTNQSATLISNGVSIEYQLTDNLPAIKGNPTQIRQVIMNLILNASDAMIDKKGTITVSTGIMECDHSYLMETYIDENLPEGQYVYVEVSDTGCGMTTEIQAKIFDPFFTTKLRGRGMGLSAVLGIIHAHQAAIKIQSEPERGSTFRILFPVCVCGVSP